MTRLSLHLALLSIVTGNALCHSQPALHVYQGLPLVSEAVDSLDFNVTTSLTQSAATTPAPTARAVVTVPDADVLCASSWWSWRNGSASSRLLSAKSEEEARTKPSHYSMESYSFRQLDVVTLYSTKSYTECDGIPRYSLKITGYNTIAKTFTGTYPDRKVSQYINDHPLPTCSLTGSACYDNWKQISNLDGNNVAFAKVIDPMPRYDSFGDMKIDFFNCKPPADLCEAAFGRCYIVAQAIALVYFKPRLKRRDLCGKDGHGVFEIEGEESTGEDPQTFVTTALTVDQRASCSGCSMKQTVLTGQWTFTSPTVYVAYAGVGAEQYCRTIGSTYSGVIPVPVSELQTIAYRPWEEPPKNVWNGSDLQFVQSMAAGLIQEYGFGNDQNRVPLNIADLEEPIPAINYFQQQGYCPSTRGNCSAIVEGDYYPQFVPPSRLWGLDTAWSSCTVSEGRWMWDPAIELPTTTRRHGPTAPAWATHSRATSTAVATSLDRVNPATPGGTVSALPMVTGGASSPGTFGQRVAQEPPEWQGAAIPASATKIQATLVAGNPGVIAVGANLLVDNGPGYMLSGQVVSLGQGGLVFGTRTLSIEYATVSANLRDLIASKVAPAPPQQGEANIIAEHRSSPDIAQSISQGSTLPSEEEGGGIDVQSQDQSSIPSRSLRASTTVQGQAHAAESSNSAISTSKKSEGTRRRQVPALVRLLRGFWT